MNGCVVNLKCQAVLWHVPKQRLFCFVFEDLPVLALLEAIGPTAVGVSHTDVWHCWPLLWTKHSNQLQCHWRWSVPCNPPDKQAGKLAASAF